MAITTAVGLGVIAAATIPFVAERTGFDIAGLLTGELIRIPFTHIALHWSWLIFSIVTLIAWAALKAADSR